MKIFKALFYARSLMILNALTLTGIMTGYAGGPRVELPEGVPQSHICVLGGTNLATTMTRAEYINGSFTIETRFGPSPEIYYGKVEGVDFYHIPLHGMIGVDPSKDNAIVDRLITTWATLYDLGVTEVLGGATAGAINPDYQLGDWVIADDFIDFNVNRPRSIAYKIMGMEAGYITPRLVPATDPELDRILYEAAKKHGEGVKAWKGGVIAQAAGGRFETAAEIRMMKMMGCDLVTMVVPTEISYARQLGMNYGSIIGMSNPAEGLGDWEWDTLTDLYPQFHAQSAKIYVEAIPKVAALQGRPRAGDALRVHPDLESKEEKK